MTNEEIMDAGNHARSRIPDEGDFCICIKAKDPTTEDSSKTYVLTFVSEEDAKQFLGQGFDQWNFGLGDYFDDWEEWEGLTDDARSSDADLLWSGPVSGLMNGMDDIPRLLRSCVRENAQDKDVVPDAVLSSAELVALFKTLESTDDPLRGAAARLNEYIAQFRCSRPSRESVGSFEHWESDSCLSSLQGGEFSWSADKEHEAVRCEYSRLAEKYSCSDEDEEEDDECCENRDVIWMGRLLDLMKSDEPFPRITRMFYRRHTTEADSPIPDNEEEAFIDSLSDFEDDGAGMSEYGDVLDED